MDEWKISPVNELLIVHLQVAGCCMAAAGGSWGGSVWEGSSLHVFPAAAAAADYVSALIYCFWTAARGLWFHFQFICTVIKHRSKAIKAAWWKTMITNWTKRNKWAGEQLRRGGGRGRGGGGGTEQRWRTTARFSPIESINVYERPSRHCKKFRNSILKHHRDLKAHGQNQCRTSTGPSCCVTLLIGLQRLLLLETNFNFNVHISQETQSRPLNNRQTSSVHTCQLFHLQVWFLLHELLCWSEHNSEIRQFQGVRRVHGCFGSNGLINSHKLT